MDIIRWNLERRVDDMIVMHQYELIFLKTMKTAGTSIEISMAKNCGANDIVTPIFPEKSGHHKQNWRGWFSPLKGVNSYSDIKKNIIDFSRRDRFYNHIPARFAKARLPKNIWNNYLKVCVERNPWDKTLSHFHMFKNAKWHRLYDPTLTLDQYLENGIFCHNAPIYLDSRGNVMVDRILNYDNLTTELPALFDEVGLPFDGLVHAKSDTRKDRRHYRDIFTNQQRIIIESSFDDEIKLHGWKF